MTSPSPRVAVVGAGVAGLAAAIRLSEAGAEVSVHDPQFAAGGLAGGFEVEGTSVERFYHHLFRSDVIAADWIRSLGLGPRLEFLSATQGFFSGGHLYPFGTPASLLRFGAMRFTDRVRLGLRLRQISTTPSSAPFERISAMDWLRVRSSPGELRVFWEPLLNAKFGPDRDLVSMAWLWARFRARVGGSIGASERLGYLRGGFQQLSDALADRARLLGADVRLSSRVVGVDIEAGRVTALRTEAGADKVDAVVWTPSLRALAKLVPELPEAYRAKCEGIRYHHAVVMVVELSKSALPFYWVTVGDPDLPFTVAVEHTRLVPASDYGGRTLVYLGRYAPPEDPILAESDDAIRDRFLEAASRAFSETFNAPLGTHVFRAPAAQPIVPPGWATDCPPLRAPVTGLITANMAQIYPWDRGINYSLELGERAAAETLGALRDQVR